MTARASSPTLFQIVWPSARIDAALMPWLARSAALAVAFSVLIALTAHAQLRLPGMPVPFTGQTFGVLLTAALLGRRLGVAAVLLYLLEGCVGLPVFAPGAGVLSYGYLTGFVLAAWMVGCLAERGWDRKPLTTALMMAAGSAAIYVPGVLWLSRFLPGGLGAALHWGCAVFLPGDALKAALAAGLLPLGWRWLGSSAGKTRSNDAN